MKRVLSVLLAAAALLTVAASVMVTPVGAASVLYGDVYSDGKVNNRDLGLLQQHVNGWTVSIDALAADVNADGKVNNRDLGLLQQYVNGWNVQLGPAVPDVPKAELPAAGYDPDGRGCIIVESLTQEGATVTVVFKNISDKWMSEETSYLEYICTDAQGNVLTLEDKYYGALYFGMLEVGESTTLTFTLPEGTAKVAFGDYRIVYWSQWQ